MNCGVLGRDRNGIVIFANEQILSWLGYEWDELVGQSMKLLIPEELDEKLHEQLKAIESGDIRARITIAQRKDSTTFPILIIPHRYSGPEGPFFTVVVELGTVQTARPIGGVERDVLRSCLSRIALELQTLSLTADAGVPPDLPIHHPVLAELTEREREVLIQLIAGHRVPAIANSLHISPHTVRNHLKSIYRQVGVGSQSELIEYVHSLERPNS